MREQFILVFTLLFSFVNAQNLAVSHIPDEVKENAYAVVRFNNTTVDLHSANRLNYTTEYAVTVFNESGLKFAYNQVSYDKFRSIKKFEAILYDAEGKEIRKLKNKDLKDVSAYDGFSFFVDDRIKYYDFTPTSYPFTIYYLVEIGTSNTISLPAFYPISNYDLGVENATYVLNNHSGIEIRKNESSITAWNVSKTVAGNTWTYSAKNLAPIQEEALSPSLEEIIPIVRFVPKEFELAGVKGQFTNWQEFGKWMYDNLIQNRQELSQKDKETALELVKGIEDEKEKIRILYQFMQSKTRYVNIAIGIGGWEPFPANYVSEKSYGDCKALSNYMVSLLKLVGIEGFYTVVHAERNRQFDLKKDFASLQGNHVIVNVPLEDETIWLECTSQQTAYNYLGSFTDNRYALSVGPEGGKIVTTQTFPAEKNKESIIGNGEVLANGMLKANFKIENSGIQYDQNYYSFFETETEQKKWLNKRLNDLPNLNLKNFKLENDRDNAIFTTHAEIESTLFAKNIGSEILVNLIPIGRSETYLKKNNDRKNAFEIRFGYTDDLEFDLQLPNGYHLSENFAPIIYTSEFGTYILNLEPKENGQIKIYRKYTINDGNYSKEKYNDYVEFRRKISSYDNTKILIKKI